MHAPPTKLALTFDTDWAPPFMLKEVLSLLDGVPATCLVTDEAARDVLCSASNIELGVHPNFLPDSSHGGNRLAVLETVMALVPGAQVVRSHNLFQDSTVLDMYVEYGLQYDLTLLEYGNPSPKAFRYWNGLVRLPCNFEDDIACMRGDGLIVQPWMSTCSLLVCTFHPVHIYLNTDTMGRYAALRNWDIKMVTPKEVASFVNHDKPGVRTLLMSLLTQISQGLRVPFTISGLMDTLAVESWVAHVRGRLSTQHA